MLRCMKEFLSDFSIRPEKIVPGLGTQYDLVIFKPSSLEYKMANVQYRMATFFYAISFQPVYKLVAGSPFIF